MKSFTILLFAISLLLVPLHHAGTINEIEDSNSSEMINKDVLLDNAKKLFDQGRQFLKKHRYGFDEETLLLYLAQLGEIEILIQQIKLTSNQERLKHFKEQLDIHQNTID
ncbi:hypothetical protein BLA29_001509, partial [Euroglyphus maynei]